MAQHLFTSGEFAHICGIRKDTLLYYDSIGLLPPELVAPNGYRYYSTKQFYTYHIISTLKEAGASLEEICNYLRNQTTQDFLRILEQKQQELSAEQQHLQRMQKLLANTIHTTRQALQAPVGQVHLAHFPEKYLLATPAPPPSATAQEKQYMLALQSHIDYCRTHMHSVEFPIGEIVLQEDLQRGIFTESYYCSHIDRPLHDPRLLIKPTGLYAVLYHQGAYSTLPDAYRALSDYILHHHYHIAGNAYEMDMLNFLSVDNRDSYLLRIAIQISS